MELNLNIIGYLLIALGLFHAAFPKYFQWKKELSSMSLMNRQMMYIHTLFIALVVLLMGLLCVTSSPELIETRLGKKVTFGLFIFWGARFVIQFVGYSSELWKGKRFETLVHILFSILWAYISGVFFLVYWNTADTVPQ